MNGGVRIHSHDCEKQYLVLYPLLRVIVFIAQEAKLKFWEEFIHCPLNQYKTECSGCKHDLNQPY